MPMQTTVLNGTKLAAKIKAEVCEQACEFTDKHGRQPKLAVILVGNNPASEIYVRNKNKDCTECGIDQETINIRANANQSVVLDCIKKLNDDPDVDGILVQMPLPKHIDPMAIMAAIDPKKDVDCFTPENVGRLWTGNQPVLKPCTPAGIVDLLNEYIHPLLLHGRNAVIINRSNIVGRPLIAMLLEHGLDMTVTVCHSNTYAHELSWHIKHADLLVTAVGKPDFITPKSIREGAMVIDVSMNHDKHGQLCGDCADLTGIAGAITPVPGGVGPMTRAELMRNVMTAAKLNTGN